MSSIGSLRSEFERFMDEQDKMLSGVLEKVGLKTR